MILDFPLLLFFFKFVQFFIFGTGVILFVDYGLTRGIILFPIILVASFVDMLCSFILVLLFGFTGTYF